MATDTLKTNYTVGGTLVCDAASWTFASGDLVLVFKSKDTWVRVTVTRTGTTNQYTTSRVSGTVADGATITTPATCQSDTVGVTHKIVINGRGYKVAGATGNWTRLRANDFAPKMATGPRTHSDLDGWDVWSMDDWSGGAGLEKWKAGSENRFAESDGAETRVPGRVTLGGFWISTAGPHAGCIAKHVEYLSCVWGLFSNGSVASYNTGSEAYNAASKTGMGGACTDGAVLGAWLGVGVGHATDMWRFDGSTWSPLAGIKCNACVTWKDQFWRAWDNLIASTSDLGTPAWTTPPIAVGSADARINSLWVADGVLCIGKEDGLYTYDPDRTPSVVEVLNLKNQLFAGNFSRPCCWNGFSFFNIQNRVFQARGLSGSSPTFTDITPKLWGSRERELWGWGTPVAFAASPGYVYVGFDKAQNLYPAVLAYDGQGWHILYFVPGPGITVNTVFYSRLTARLFFSNGAAGGWYDFVQKYNALAQTVISNYASPLTLITPWFDAGLPEIPKAFKEVVVDSRDCNPDEKVSFWYELDETGSWVSMGDVTASPQQALALSSISTAVSGKKIRFKITLSRGADMSKTPELLGVTLKYLLRPDTVYAYKTTLILADDQEDDQGHPMDSFQTQYDQLMEEEASTTPIPVDTADGYRHMAYITSSRVVVVE